MLIRRSIFAAVVVLVTGVIGVAQSKSHPTMLVRCAVWNEAAEDALMAMPRVDVIDNDPCGSCRHHHAPSVMLHCLIHPEDLGQLATLGYQPTIVQPDLERHYASNLRTPLSATPLGSMGGYFTYTEVNNLLDQWRQQYPNLITARQSIGKTVQNRDQWIVKISANADTDENEPEFLIHTLIHSREPAGLMAMMRAVEYFLERYGTDPVVTDLLDNREIWFLPVANPDGYEYNRQTNPNGGGLWRKNRSGSGVDLNRNFGFQWGYDSRGSSGSPSSQTYRGPSAFSEPETQNIRNFVNARVPLGLTTAWDCHCYGALLMYPFGYANVRSPRDAAYAEMTADMAQENNYTTGPVNTTIYPANGVTVDWYEGAAGLWSWTPEMGHRSGDGFWPPTARIKAIAEENLRMVLTAVKYAGPYLITKSVNVQEVGNNNGAYDPGERIELTTVVRNRGVATANALVRLVSTSPFVAIEVGQQSLGAIATVTDADNVANPLRCRINPATPPGTDLGLALELAFDGHVLRVPVDAKVGAGTVLVNDPCETATWTRGIPSDRAVRGIWTHGDPVETYATSNRKFVVQTGDDHTPNGTRCYVTGNQSTSSGDADDVDGGQTTLLTPVYDLSAARNPYVSFWRWFMDHGPEPNNDVLQVDVTNNGGMTWSTIAFVDYSDPRWVKHEFRLRDYVTPSAQVQLRFVTGDAPDDSFCEALIDDLMIVDYDDGVRIALSGSTKIGQTANIDLTATRSASLPFVTGISFGTSPGIGLTGRTLPLNADPLFLSFWLLPQIFKDFTGTLDAGGSGRSQIVIPNDAILVGVATHVAFLTLDAGAPDGIRDISEALNVTFTAP